MLAWSRRSWLTWSPPVVIALVVLIALQTSGGASDDGTAAPPSPSLSETTLQPQGDAVTPTTGFADREPTLPADPFDYGVELPAHVGAGADAFDTRPAGVAESDEIATLGRVLFYDVNLSANRTVRCASCHSQVHSFTDPLVRSQGLLGVRTRRNSMALANVGFNPSGRYLWGEQAPSLEEQVVMPFVDPLEMGMSRDGLLARIEEQSYYEPLFDAAYGDDQVTEGRVSTALAQFLRAMVSVDSPYDDGRAEVSSPLEPFPNFTDMENEGKQLFFTPIADGGGGCAGCHVGELQLNRPGGLANNGIDRPTAEFQAPDLGAFEATGVRRDVGRFRVPSLRNIEVTGPYMHDGRLESLADVIDHYNTTIQPHENLSDELRDDAGGPVRLGFDEGQVAALVAFLHTLTDDEFLRDERFGEPFRSP
ncbi:MAG: cytochrome-c peroxidase [Acidimicrobiales bacterium]